MPAREKFLALPARTLSVSLLCLPPRRSASHSAAGKTSRSPRPAASWPSRNPHPPRETSRRASSTPYRRTPLFQIVAPPARRRSWYHRANLDFSSPFWPLPWEILLPVSAVAAIHRPSTSSPAAAAPAPRLPARSAAPYLVPPWHPPIVLPVPVARRVPHAAGLLSSAVPPPAPQSLCPLAQAARRPHNPSTPPHPSLRRPLCRPGSRPAALRIPQAIVSPPLRVLASQRCGRMQQCCQPRIRPIRQRLPTRRPGQFCGGAASCTPAAPGVGIFDRFFRSSSQLLPNGSFYRSLSLWNADQISPVDVSRYQR